RTRELRGSIRVQCEQGTIELLRGNFTQLLIHRAAGSAGLSDAPIPLIAQAPGSEGFSGYDAFRAQIDDWVNAISGGSRPCLSGRSVLPVVRLIEECYAHRTLMSEPWVEEGLIAAVRRDTPSTVH